MGLPPELRLQVLEYREHASMQFGLRAESELVEDRGDVILDRANGYGQFSRDSRVRSALGHKAEHLALARCEIADLPRDARSRDQALDDLGIQGRPAARHAQDRGREQRQIADPILQQVSNPLGAFADQLERISGFEMLGEDYDADAGMIRAYLPHRAQPVVAVRRRHLNIRDDDVGLVSVDLASEVDRVGGLAHHFKSRLFEHGHDAGADERLILADNDP